MVEIKMRGLFAILCVFTLWIQCRGRKLEKCELVRELRKQGFPEDKMRDWVCLVKYESDSQTDVIGPTNKDGSRDYGLFQINDKWWCNRGSRPGKECNVTCADLLLDDITIACNCAKKIYKRSRFSAWNAWRAHCQSDLPDISNCTATLT